MRRIISVLIVCVMLLPAVCVADRQTSESGKQMADGAAEMLSAMIKVYDFGVEFKEDQANKLYEYILLYCTGYIMYFCESEYSTLEMRKELAKGYAGVIEYNCKAYQDYADGKISLKVYVGNTINMVRAFVDNDASRD